VKEVLVVIVADRGWGRRSNKKRKEQSTKQKEKKKGGGGGGGVTKGVLGIKVDKFGEASFQFLYICLDG
jgi:hypothetical protein